MLRQFNGLGQLTTEYQSNSGAVNTSTTPAVQYAYTAMAGGVNNSRLTSITYPSGYVLSYNYGSSGGLNDTISRLQSLSDSAGTLESYKYLGLNTIVERDHPQNNVNQTFISQTSSTGDAGDPYTGLDRFGRVVEQNWYNTATSSSVEDLLYGYDQNSNALYRQNLVDAVFSQLYQNDNLGQLTNFQQGTLNSTKDGLVGSSSASQTWSPDALGNFTSSTTNGSTQTETVNQQNQITAISGAGTTTYDGNGNMTADGSGKTFVFDAWNHLVAVKSGSTTLAAYQVDGLGRRITETHGSSTTVLYYSAGWQVLEERVGGVVQARNVWSPAYVDALVLCDQSSLGNGVLDQRLYVVQDANWNVTALMDASGNVVERYVYNPYGALTILAGDWSARGTSSYGWLYLHQGGRLDSISGLYLFRNRDYSPTLQRWMENDPLGFGAGDNNTYRTEGNDPTNIVDPTGTTGLGRKDIQIVGWLDRFLDISTGVNMLYTDGSSNRYWLQTTKDFQKVLQAAVDGNKTIAQLTVTSHGGPEGVVFNNDSNNPEMILVSGNNRIMTADSKDITNLMRKALDPFATVSFVGFDVAGGEIHSPSG